MSSPSIKPSVNAAYAFAWGNWTQNWLLFFVLLITSWIVGIDLVGIVVGIAGATASVAPQIVEGIQSLTGLIATAISIVVSYMIIRYAIGSAQGTKLSFRTIMPTKAMDVVRFFLATILISLIAGATALPLIGHLTALFIRLIYPSLGQWEAAWNAEEALVGGLIWDLISQTWGMVTIADWMILGATTLILLVGSFIISLIFWAAPFAVVHQNMGPIVALKYSTEITKGHRMALVGLMVYNWVVAIAGFMALMVGLLVALPIIAIAGAHFYLQLVGSIGLPSAPKPDMPTPPPSEA